MSDYLEYVEEECQRYRRMYNQEWQEKKELEQAMYDQLTDIRLEIQKIPDLVLDMTKAYYSDTELQNKILVIVGDIKVKIQEGLEKCGY